MSEKKIMETAYKLKGSDVVVFDKSHIVNAKKLEFETVGVLVPYSWIKEKSQIIEREDDEDEGS